TTAVTDNGNPSLGSTNSFAVVVREVNQAPVLSALGTQTVNEQTLFTATNAATEPNIHSTTVGYGLVGAPLGMGVDTNGVITWTPTQQQSPSTNPVTLWVTNSNPY